MPTISQGAVEKNGEKFSDDLVLGDLKSGDLLRVGKQSFLRVVR